MEETTTSQVPSTILVVDDDTDAREILTLTLQAAGYTVLTAVSGTTCLEIVQSREVDVILLDVMMPEMDGLRVCQELKKTVAGATIPVILVTARDDVSTRAAGMRLDVSEFLTKPVNTVELLQRIQSQLHVREISRQLDYSNRKIGALPGD